MIMQKLIFTLITLIVLTLSCKKENENLDASARFKIFDKIIDITSDNNQIITGRRAWFFNSNN